MSTTQTVILLMLSPLYALIVIDGIVVIVALIVVPGPDRLQVLAYHGKLYRWFINRLPKLPSVKVSLSRDESLDDEQRELG